jgi:hypothetical protein
VASRCMEELGREEKKGGPMEWEAHPVCHENGPRPLSWPVFSTIFFFDPATDLKPRNDRYRRRRPTRQDAGKPTRAYDEMEAAQRGLVELSGESNPTTATRNQPRHIGYEDMEPIAHDFPHETTCKTQTMIVRPDDGT